MVSLRCKAAVGEALTKLGIQCTLIELGEVEIAGNGITNEQQEQIALTLAQSGFELIFGKKVILAQRIKNAIIDLVHYSAEPLLIKLSEYLSRKLHYDYTYMANVFSDINGMTIEKFYIINRVEYVKELLMYELTVTEIAYKMHYSSIAHLSSQFKKVTGLTPSQYKQLNSKNRSMLEDL